MATPHPSDQHILEKTVSALNNISHDRVVAGDGLSDARIAALANPATVSLLATSVDALAWHASDTHVRDGAAAAIRIAGEPMFALGAPTMGTVTTANSGGTLTNSTAYFYVVVPMDRNGNPGTPSAEGTVTTGSGGAGNAHVNTIPWTDPTGGFSFRVWKGTATGVYTSYKDVTDATSTTDPGSGYTSGSATTASLAAAAVGGYGLITDDMVDDARDAGSVNFATLRNAVADQHPSLSQTDCRALDNTHNVHAFVP